ncbi:unnamed protein product [Trichobilharzia szidati]|nr:unnamed protein product [Trichobilharzia szidati]
MSLKVLLTTVYVVFVLLCNNQVTSTGIDSLRYYGYNTPMEIEHRYDPDLFLKGTETSPNNITGVTTNEAVNKSSKNIRLPQTVFPHFYDLRLQVHIHGNADTQDFYFNGSVTIKIQCLAATADLFIHAYPNLNVSMDQIRFTVWTRPEKIESARYALDIGRRLLTHFENYFGVPYSLPKMDMVALPNFYSDAMENWGLIICRENGLLWNPSTGAAASKLLVTVTIAHEISHQDRQFIINDMQGAMISDASTESHPVINSAEYPGEIEDIFDPITYSKAASIIRMMESFLGHDVFLNGMKNIPDSARPQIIGDLFHLANLIILLILSPVNSEYTFHSIPPGLKSAVYCTAIRFGGQAEWKFLRNQYNVNETEDVEKENILTGLSCSRDIWTMKLYFDWIKQDRQYWSAIPEFAVSPIGNKMLWDYVHELVKSLKTDMENSTRSPTEIDEFTKEVIQSLSNPYYSLNNKNDGEKILSTEADWLQLPQNHPLKRELYNLLTTSKRNLKWLDTHLHTILQWLKENIPHTAQEV